MRRMATTAALLDATLKAQGIPILGVSIGTDSDRNTWVVQYDPSATPQQQQTGESIRSTFSPTDPSVVAADLDRQANAAAVTMVKALCALVLDQKLGRSLTTADIPAVQALFSKAIGYY